MNKDESVKALITDPVLQQRLAKYLVLKCFRNSVLEDLHAGIIPDSKSGDYTDVVVRTPFGEIPWNDLSRLDDAEMKALMIDAVNVTYHLIQELFDEERGGELLLKLAAQYPAPDWNDVDRVFKTLDGKKYVERSLSCAMNTAFQDGGYYEDEYFAAKAYKNGNLHLRFKRADLVEKVNLIIAKRYGSVIGNRA